MNYESVFIYECGQPNPATKALPYKERMGENLVGLRGERYNQLRVEILIDRPLFVGPKFGRGVN